MTSASELFYTRRSRFGRDAAADSPGLESSLRRSSHHGSSRRHHTNHNHNPHHRLNWDACDAGPPQPPYPSYRTSHSDREVVSLNPGGSHFGSGNSTSSELSTRISNRLGFTQNERLPGSVLLARERLLERLRGVSLSRNRRSSRTLSGVRHGENSGDEFSLIGARDWETETLIGHSAGGHITELAFQGEQLPYSQEPNKKKPPGLSQEALNCLSVEVFLGKCNEGRVCRASGDCSICLDSFSEGDELIRLPCGHRFHSACLDPWLRSCGDCPYCRRPIVLVAIKTDGRRTESSHLGFF